MCFLWWVLLLCLLYLLLRGLFQTAMLVCETFDFSATLAQNPPGNITQDGKLVLEAGNVVHAVTLPDGAVREVISACTQTIDGKKMKNGSIVVYGQTLVRKSADGANGIPGNCRYVHAGDRTAERGTMVEVFVTEPWRA